MGILVLARQQGRNAVIPVEAPEIGIDLLAEARDRRILPGDGRTPAPAPPALT
jgi:hypothetical protein